MFLFRAAVVLLACTLLPFAAVDAQSKKELEQKRKNLLREIEQTDKMLKKTSKSRETTYSRFVALQKQILQRESLVETVQFEIEAANQSIVRTEDVIDALNQDIVDMRNEYGQMVRNAFRHKMLNNPLLYLLSAANLNQAFRRWLFLRKYDAFRRQQADAIRFTQEMLTNRLTTLAEERKEKEQLLLTLDSQKETLGQELQDKDALLKTLKKDEAKLKSQLSQQQRAHEELNKAIEEIITAEIVKRNREARKTTKDNTADKPSAASVVTISADETVARAMTNSFRNQRGKLPMPVQEGFVTRKFGRQKHPTLTNVEITNNGIDISTQEGESVLAVHEGIVAGVQFIPGHDYTVILQHGSYYTVYSNLGSSAVQKGQTVSANELLGRVSNNPITGTAELHFEVWNNKTRMNPSLWVK